MKKRLISAALCAAMLFTALYVCFIPAQAAGDPLKMLVISDTHYGYGTSAITDMMFDQIATGAEYAGYDIVLISGDLTDHGAVGEHDSFLGKLRALETAGKQVYVVTADHDYKGGSSGYTGASYERNQLPGLYADFGFGGALAVFPGDNLNYVAQLAPGYRLLVLNFDREREFTQAQFDWALTQVRDAGAAGEQIIGMWHYPVLASLPVYMFKQAGVINDPDSMGKLADAGLRYGFSGHIHGQNIDYIKTKAGNLFYEITTASTCKSPSSPIRKVTLGADGRMDITTGFTQGNYNGVPIAEFLSDKQDETTRGLLEALGTSADLLEERIYGAVGYDIEVSQYEKLIVFLGKQVNSLTMGQLSWWFLCPWTVSKELRNVKLSDFLVEAVNNFFIGEKSYSRKSPQGRAFFALVCRLDLIFVPVAYILRLLGRFELFGIEIPVKSLTEFFTPMLTNPISGNDVSLPC